MHTGRFDCYRVREKTDCTKERAITMDAKRTVKKFIGPNLILAIVFLIPPLTAIGLLVLLFTTLPTSIRAKKTITRLENSGELIKVANEMMSANAKHMIKGNVILTDNYVICKNTGYIFRYDEIRWVYRHRFTQSVLLIPIKVTDSLYLATQSMSARGVASMGKDKNEEIKAAILEIYSHNNNCLVGYTDENKARYRALAK